MKPTANEFKDFAEFRQALRLLASPEEAISQLLPMCLLIQYYLKERPNLYFKIIERYGKKYFCIPEEMLYELGLWVDTLCNEYGQK